MTRKNKGCVVISVSLGFEDFKSLGLVAGSDNSVGNLALDKLSGGNVALVGESHPVAEGIANLRGSILQGSPRAFLFSAQRAQHRVGKSGALFAAEPLGKLYRLVTGGTVGNAIHIK